MLSLGCIDSRSVDLIDVFQRSERVPDFVDDALAAGSPYFWMQLGIRNAAARAP